MSTRKAVAYSDANASATKTATIVDTPAAADYVLAVYSCVNTNTVTSVTGMGATWDTPVGISAANITTWFLIGRTPNASGAVTVNLSTTRNGSMTVELVGDVPSGATLTHDTFYTASGTGITGPSQSAAAGSYVCAAMASGGPITTFPDVQTPSGAWTAETAISGSFHALKLAYATPASTASYSVTGVAGNFVDKRISQVVLAAAGGGGPTNYPVSGTVAATSAVSGTATSTQKISGTVAAVSGVSGALYTPPGTDFPVSGTVDAVSGVSGAITITGAPSTGVSGTVAATSAVQGGGLTLSHALSGTVGAISGGSGAVTVPLVVDPLTRTPQYQLIVVKPDGTRLGELNKAQALSPLEHDFAGESWDFAMPAHDPKTALTLGARREIQVWRGGQLLRWGPIIKRSGDDVQVRISCGSVRWYLDQKAVIGKLPKTDLLVNGDFSDGETGWSFGYDPTSIPALPPLHSIVPEGADGSNALKISGADESQLVTNTLQTLTIFVPNEATYLSGGEQKILDFAATLPPAPVGVIEGHTADADGGTGYALSLARANAVRSTIMTVRPAASFTTVGKGETEPTGQGWDADRRVVIKYEGLLPADGHRQYAYQRLYYMVPEAAKWPMQVVFIGTIKILDFVASSKDGWSVYIHRVNPSNRAEVLDYGTAPLDKDTPRGVWIKQECSIEVPADGVTYELEVRFYPPSGDALWDRGGLFPAERLGFVDVRQEHIIEHLVEHAQDPAVGNDNLFILNRPAFSGITRQRRYDFHERRSVGDAINDFMALDDGLEVDMEFTPTQKFLTSYYPRKGQDTGLTLSCPGKIMRFDVQEDATQVGNVAVVRADGSGPGQEESYAIDADALDGLRLQRTFNAEQEMPAWELGQAADRQLARFRTPPLLWSITCDPKWTSWLLDRVKLGDTVRCVIDAGWAKIDGPVRIVGESLDPATDAITYDIDVEV